MRKLSKAKLLSERGTVKALVYAPCMPLPASPGMTGTGAPVTERLRYPHFADELGWYREFFAPIDSIGAFSFSATREFVIYYGG